MSDRDLIRADSTILEISQSGSSIYLEIDQDRSFLELTSDEVRQIIRALTEALKYNERSTE